MASGTNHPAGGGGDHPPHFVREWREYMNWSQEMLAAKAHVSQSKIQRVETGKRGLKTDFLHKLARVFNVPASALLETNPATPEGAQTAELLIGWAHLTPNQRADLLKMVRALIPPNDKPNAS